MIATGRLVSVQIGETSTVRPDDVLVQPIDFDAFRNGIPPEAFYRGHFANQLVAYVGKVRPDAYPEILKLYPGHIPVLQSVPLRDLLYRLRDVARLSHPDVSLAEALRRVGRFGYEFALSSLLGKILLSAIGKDPELWFRMVPRVQSWAGTGARQVYTSLGSRQFRYDYEVSYTWLDCVQVGVIEGVAAMCGCSTELKVHLAGLYHGWIECRWF